MKKGLEIRKSVLSLHRNKSQGNTNCWKDLVAQPVEHLTFNQRVLGSNPSQITNKFHKAL